MTIASSRAFCELYWLVSNCVFTWHWKLSAVNQNSSMCWTPSLSKCCENEKSLSFSLAAVGHEVTVHTHVRISCDSSSNANKKKCHSGEVVCLLTLELFTPTDVKLRAWSTGHEVPYKDQPRRSDHNTGNSVPYSLRIVCGFFHVPQIFTTRVVRRDLRLIVLIREDLKV